MVDLTSFGDRLRYVRQRAGLSQYDVADLSGIPQPNISRLEHNEPPNPSRFTIVRLCRALKVSSDFLLGIGPFKNPLDDED
jgi:transcriptional regulator with XRE-family HTH domain